MPYLPPSKKRFRKLTPDTPNQGRKERSKLYDTQRWREHRLHFLQSNPLCVHCSMKGKVTAANVVDHIIPVRVDDSINFFDSDNHQSLCESCHNRKSQTERFGKWYERREKGTHTEVLIVNGPPASGKTTWVTKHKQEGDLILDLDTIWQALTGLPLYEKPVQLNPVVFAVRDTILDSIGQMPGLKRAIILTTNTRTPAMIAFMNRHRCQVVDMDADEQTCIDRILNDRKRKNKGQHVQLVRDWFDNSRRVNITI
jgi:hypothetical protein